MNRKKSFSKSRSRDEITAAASITSHSSSRPTSPVTVGLEPIITRANSPFVSSNSPRSANVEEAPIVPYIEHHITELPSEVLLYIFRYLQLKHFLTVRSVCHDWQITMFPIWEYFYKQKWRIAHNTTNLFHQQLLQWRFLFLERSKILYYSHHQLNQYDHFHQHQPEDDAFFQQQQKKKKKLSATNLMEWYNDEGYRFIYNNQFYRALECFELALQIQRNARAYEGMARVYSQLNQYTHVIIFCDAALSQTNALNITELYYLRGKALLNMNRFQECLKDFHKTCQYLSISPVNYHLYVKEIDVLYDKMMCYMEMNQLDSTFKECQKIMEKDKFMEKGDVLWCCARNFFAKKHFAEAEFFCEKMAKMGAKTVTTHSQAYHLLYMQCQVQTNKFESALKHFVDSNVSTHQLDSQVLIDVALTHFMNQQIEKSLDYFVASILQSMEDSQQLMLIDSISQIKRQVFQSVLHQQTQCRILAVPFFDLQVAWGIYYYLLGKLYLHNYCKTQSRNELRESIQHFTRCIALNPTLSEALYYKSVVQCYSIIDDLLANYCPLTQIITHQWIAKKISSSNLLMECLHDLNDAFSLLQTQDRPEFCVQVQIFRCFVCLGVTNRKLEAKDMLNSILEHHSVVLTQKFHEEMQLLQWLVLSNQEGIPQMGKLDLNDPEDLLRVILHSIACKRAAQ